LRSLPANCCQFNILTQLLNYYLLFLLRENPSILYIKAAKSLDLIVVFVAEIINCRLAISIFLPLLLDNL